METNVNYTIVGVFVITLVGAIILATIWLSSGFSFENYTYYTVYMQESVSGLNLESAVEYNGVDVGNVKRISLNRKNPQLVELIIKIKNSTPITRGTVATLASRGFTGVVYLALKDMSTDLRPLIAGPGQPYPVIPSAPSIFVRLDIALSRASQNLQRITHAIEGLLDKENLERFKDILANIENVTGALADNSDKLSGIMTNMQKATQQMTPFMTSGTRTMRIIETQTLPATSRLFNNLDELTQTLSKISREIKQNPSILIRGSAPPVLGPGER